MSNDKSKQMPLNGADAASGPVSYDEIIQITDKRVYMDLLLLGDEQESMIDKYLDRGVMFAVFKNGKAIAQAVVTDEGGGIAEIKNIAVAPTEQRCGIGKRLIEHICRVYGKRCDILQVGTGAGTPTVKFYEKCGFTVSHTVERFFVDNYDHPIYEDGVRLTDMVYLRKALR